MQYTKIFDPTEQSRPPDLLASLAAFGRVAPNGDCGDTLRVGVENPFTDLLAPAEIIIRFQTVTNRITGQNQLKLSETEKA